MKVTADSKLASLAARQDARLALRAARTGDRRTALRAADRSERAAARAAYAGADVSGPLETCRYARLLVSSPSILGAITAALYSTVGSVAR